MIESLHIENIAVVKTVDIDFTDGMTVLSGETGAGKSIIIDSINLLLGGRADKELIRNGENTALVSALFTDIPSIILERLDELGLAPDENGEFFVQRTISLDGRSKITINGRTCPLSLLKESAGLLVNIHGQHDSKYLLENKFHIDILDSYADTFSANQ